MKFGICGSLKVGTSATSTPNDSDHAECIQVSTKCMLKHVTRNTLLQTVPFC